MAYFDVKLTLPSLTTIKVEFGFKNDVTGDLMLFGYDSSSDANWYFQYYGIDSALTTISTDIATIKTDIGLMGVFLVLNSSIISGANFLVTYRYLSTLNNRKMRDARVFFTESIIVAC
jgi:hypothetical protein